MLRVETTGRATRSVGYPMSSANFPVHCDLEGLDFEASPVDRKLVVQLAETTFADAAHNVVLVEWSRAYTPNADKPQTSQCQ